MKTEETMKIYFKQCFMHSPETGVVMYKIRPLEHFKNHSEQMNWNSINAEILAGYDQKDSCIVLDDVSYSYDDIVNKLSGINFL